jgi:hypothetical protein
MRIQICTLGNSLIFASFNTSKAYQEGIRMILFPFSLKDNARQMRKVLPSPKDKADEKRNSIFST